MQPFLHLSIREHDGAAAAEVRSIARFAGLGPGELVHVRAEQQPLPAFDPRAWRGVFIGGGPFNASDEVRSPVQMRVEADLARIVETCLSAELPLLGLCYGVGVVTRTLGGIVAKQYSEPTSGVPITLTEEGRLDPLFAGLPSTFAAFTGHKESCVRVPEGATLLATGEVCPVQAYRVGSIAVTQFHPELDLDALVERMLIYADGGYFDPAEFDVVAQRAREAGVDETVGRVLRNFVVHADTAAAGRG